MTLQENNVEFYTRVLKKTLVYAVLVLDLKLSGCRSLKQKRSLIKPLLNRLHREFNISSAEMDKNDIWDESVVACGLIGNEKGAAEYQLNVILRFVEKYWRDIEVIDFSISFL